jgi:hypothetical protein
MEDPPFLRKFVELKDASLNAILFKGMAPAHRMSFVYQYVMLTHAVPEGVDWAPLFTPDTAAEFVACYVREYHGFWNYYSFHSTNVSVIAPIARLWELCGFPVLPVWADRTMCHYDFTPTKRTETAAETLLRQHLQYAEYVASRAIGLPEDMEHLEAYIATAERRGDRGLLTRMGRLCRRQCQGVVCAKSLAKRIVLDPSDSEATACLEYLFTSAEATDAVFVKELRATIAKATPAVAEILTSYSTPFEASLRFAWVSACVNRPVISTPDARVHKSLKTA